MTKTALNRSRVFPAVCFSRRLPGDFSLRGAATLTRVLGMTTLLLGLGCQNDVVGGNPPVTPHDAAAGNYDGFVIILPDAFPRYDDASVNMGYDGGSADAPSVAICGDGILESGETCDDGNGKPGDGCSGICTTEPGYVCLTPGVLCVSVVTQTCGNSTIEGSEDCDDGNTVSGDGCSSSCIIEVLPSGSWSCPVPGQPCVRVAATSICGNSTVESGEQCDDGNTVSGDGCSSVCQREDRWTCPTPGKACVKVEYCGDGIVQAARGEVCDDGNLVPGDGCTGLCTVEAGYSCPPTGGACTKTWVCGNGIVDPGEACDDGNTVAGDGCSADCATVEPRHVCPKGANNTGGPCTLIPQNVCGDGVRSAAEGCDDGNTVSGDGCSSACLAEPGWICPAAGGACKLTEFCGDSVVEVSLGETCDDGNTVGGDGCNPQCTVEPNYICPVAGAPCQSTQLCGDSKITGTEQCDDGNTVAGDGCGATCQLEAGWTCPVVAAACSAKACGDGLLAGIEQCDDGNTVAGDGCSPSCQVESGFACGPDEWHPTMLSTQCYRTTCGDGHKEGTEQCDDGNTQPFDGCTSNCTNEPKCGYTKNDTSQPYACFSVCGDGIKMPDEACDDGNLQNGDGCSSTCTVESGYTCDAPAGALGDSLALPILYRDFNWKHPQFEVAPTYDRRQPGIVKNAIGLDGKPVYNTTYVGMDNAGALLTRATTMDGPAMNTAASTSNTTLMSDATGTTYYTKNASNPASLATADIATYFAQWYTTDPNATGNATADAANSLVTRITIQDTLPLPLISAGTYQYYSAAFFPLDGKGFGNINYPATNPTVVHNYNFTSEAHYWFQYQGGEQFEFRGDDDVWVFVNGQLAVDLGGIHSELRGIITLNGASTKVCVDDAPSTAAAPANCTTITSGFSMVAGNIYEIILFQAERHVTGSNYKLTLSGFNAPKSVCAGKCGDGVVTRGEACDLGSAKNTGLYGACNPNCTLPPRCGDGLVQTPPEECDDTVNIATYGGTVKKCGPGCLWAPYCGDGVVSNGEECDEGLTNGAGYGHCTAACTKGPRCGDGITNGTEQCDDGASNGTTTSACTSTCVLKCGNGVLDPGELCDNGTANNLGGYGKCTSTCTLGPTCGDGIKNGPELCDDGKNDGTYGTCAPGCVLAPYCGDGVINGPELCDQGPLNSTLAYGLGLCTNRCTPAPYCGDKAVDAQFGEVCDDGVNSGLPGSCTPDCKTFVPLLTCGDGVIVAPEQCDNGALNGTPLSACDANCRKKCGNGIKDPGEQCDNGVNNGSYGTCKPDCTLASYCGDGVKDPTEQCDAGVANVSLSTAYGPSICTSVCTWAPFCGDGRIQPQNGEECDGSSTCGANCKTVIIDIK